MLEAPGDFSEGCWWNLTEAWDKGNYQAIFPADLDDGLEVSLWIFPTPDPVDQPIRENQPGLDPTFPSIMLLTFCSERQRKCWGWGECHPAVVNRHNFDCSICPTEDPTTWTADDVNFKVTCGDDVGTLSFFVVMMSR